MNYLHLLAIAGIVVSGIVFFLYAKGTAEDSVTAEGYLLANKNISGNAFSSTLFATGIALGNIMFAIEFHKVYGWLMAFLPMFYDVAMVLMLYAVKSLKIDRAKYRTLAELWFAVFPCKSVARYIAILSAIVCFMSLFAELCFSSIILSIFLPDTTLFRAGAFLFMGCTVVAYVYYGGYKAIVKTDNLQLKLMMLASVVLLYFAISSPEVNSSNIAGWQSVELFSLSSHGSPLVLFIIWVIVGNICACYTDTTAWQRISAVKSFPDAIRATFKNYWKSVLVLSVPVFAFIILGAKGYEYDSLQSFLSIVEQHSGMLSYVIFPIIVVGFAAALFSSADTNVIAAIYSLCDSNTLLPKLQQASQDKQHNILKKYLTFACVLIVLLMTILFYIQDGNIGNFLMPLLYAVWNQISILAPLAIYSLYRLSKNKKPIMATPMKSAMLIACLLISWVTILLGAWQHEATGNDIYSQATFFLGIIIVSIGVFLVTLGSKENVTN